MLETGENELGRWSLKYFPPTGGKYFGLIIITNFRLIFVKKNLEKAGKGVGLNLLKSEISSVSIKNNLIFKSIIISVNGKNHSFSKFFFNTQNFIKAIRN